MNQGSLLLSVNRNRSFLYILEQGDKTFQRGERSKKKRNFHEVYRVRWSCWFSHQRLSNVVLVALNGKKDKPSSTLESKSKSCPLQNWWKFGFSLSSSSSNRDQTNFGLSSAQSMFISWLSEGCLMQCLVGKVANPIVRKCIYTDHDWIDAGRCSNRLCSWFVLLRVLCRENGDVERNLGLRCRLSLEMMLKSLSNQHYQKYYSLFICEHAWSFFFLSNHMKLFFTFHKPF